MHSATPPIRTQSEARSDAPRDIALEIEDLKVEFDTLEGVVSVLKGVDLAVHRGEAVGLVLAPCVVAAMLAPTHVHEASGLLRRSGIAGVVCGALPLALGWHVRLQTRRGNDVKPTSPRESPSKGWRPALPGGLPGLVAVTLASAALLVAGLGGEEHS